MPKTTCKALNCGNTGIHSSRHEGLTIWRETSDEIVTSLYGQVAVGALQCTTTVVQSTTVGAPSLYGQVEWGHLLSMGSPGVCTQNSVHDPKVSRNLKSEAFLGG